jgi:hypothetical protein
MRSFDLRQKIRGGRSRRQIDLDRFSTGSLAQAGKQEDRVRGHGVQP